MKKIKLFNQSIPAPFVALGVIEFLLLVAALYLATWLRFSHFLEGESYTDEAIHEIVGPLYPKALLFATVLFLSMMAMGLYSARSMVLGTAGVYLRLLVSHLVGFVAFVFLAYLVPSLFLGRGLMLASVALALLVVIASRQVFASLIKSNQLNRKVLVYGAGDNAARIEQMMPQLENTGVTISGFIATGDKPPRIASAPMLIDSGRSLAEYARRRHIDQIVVALDDRRGTLPIDGLVECRLQGIEVIDLPTFFENNTAKVRLDLMPPSWLIFSSGFNRGALTDIVKRGIDLVASLLLLAVSWPFMLLVAIAIKLEDGWKAPVIYRQVRIGKEGRPFEIYKFRSMRVDAEKDKPQWARDNDPRITRVGSVIRLLRLDELPQLLNVLKGDMSFVGPRPERPEFVELLSEKIPYYNERHRVKPGVTGWAQLNYPYGASDRDSMEKLQFDLYYTKNHSLMLDIAILLQTIEIVLFGKGAR